MSVYVDAMQAQYGTMTMCHMLADTSIELRQMAVSIGVNLKWIQNEGTPYEHFDICKSKRKIAVSFGAIEIDRRALGELLKGKRYHVNRERRQRSL